MFEVGNVVRTNFTTPDIFLFISQIFQRNAQVLSTLWKYTASNDNSEFLEKNLNLVDEFGSQQFFWEAHVNHFFPKNSCLLFQIFLS